MKGNFCETLKQANRINFSWQYLSNDSTFPNVTGVEGWIESIFDHPVRLRVQFFFVPRNVMEEFSLIFPVNIPQPMATIFFMH